MRNKNLDFLRALAIIGVLFQHSSWTNRITQMGWIGVDLFFVLSGFLVSGLLFNEIKNTGKVNPKLFLIRRGFKIYPAFYFFFFSTLIIRYLINDLMFPLPKILTEIFFLQSYLENIWLHTWSLAIEEHFYIFIAILLWVLYKSGLIFKKRIILSILISLWIILVALRFGYCIMHSDESPIRFFQSHLRSDGLLAGCILAYFYFFIDGTKEFLLRRKNLLLLTSVVLFIIPFAWETGSFNMDTFGITLFEFSFLIFTGIAALGIQPKVLKKINPVFNVFCYIGVYSYSIYLWHGFVMEECDLIFTNKFFHTVVYIPASLLLGILFSKLIEMPMLRVRERVFPKR